MDAGCPGKADRAAGSNRTKPMPKTAFRAERASNFPDESGVVMLKIDGLSYRQCHMALAENRLPYLRSR